MGNPAPLLGDERPLRLLGLTQQRLEFREGRVQAKCGGVFNALDGRFDLLDVRTTRMKWAPLLYSLGSNPRGGRARWIRAARLHPWAFRHRTRTAQRSLEEFEDRFDLVFQVHTLFAPGEDLSRRRYVVYTDNTFRMSERHWPEWVPVASPRIRDEWIELERAVYRNAEFVFPWSEFARRSMIEDYGVHPERAIATGSGANLVRRNVDRNDYGSQTALFVGYEFERKGGLVLLEAWDIVRRELPHARLIVVGPRAPVGERSSGIEWHARVPRSGLERLYGNASVFVLPSLFEPWGHVFLEAMGFGLPCIGTRSCAMPEIIRDGETGLLVPPREPEPLAEALIDLLGRPDRAQAMGHAAHADVLARHSWERVVDRLEPYIRRAAGTRAASSGV